MNVNRVSAIPQTASYTGRITADEADFSEQMKGFTEDEAIPKTDQIIYSGGIDTALSFYIRYSEDSTTEDPTVVARGIDENGEDFEETIHIKNINPENATIAEMRALEAYTGQEKRYGFSTLPTECGTMGLRERRNFMDMFENSINELTTMKAIKAAAYYEHSVQVYRDFMNK